MRRFLSYIMVALGIIVAFCLIFTIVAVLITRDNDSHQLVERWMPYISIILVIALPALIVWWIFRFGREFFFKKIKNQK